MNTTPAGFYAEPMKVDSAKTAQLLRRTREAAVEVERVERELEKALERRNALFAQCAAAGLSDRRISEAMGGKPVASGVRYGIMRVSQG